MNYISAPIKRKHLAMRLILNKILSAQSKIVETVNENISDFYTLKMDAFERRRDITSACRLEVAKQRIAWFRTLKSIIA